MVSGGPKKFKVFFFWKFASIFVKKNITEQTTLIKLSHTFHFILYNNFLLLLPHWNVYNNADNSLLTATKKKHNITTTQMTTQKENTRKTFSSREKNIPSSL